MSDGLYVNFSGEEANSEPVDFTPLPSGQYLCNIYEAEIAHVREGAKNAGKPYWKVTFKIDDGKYANRNIWSNVMLFEGALYSASQLFRALGYDIVPGQPFEIPPLEKLIGRQVVVTGRQVDKTDSSGKKVIGENGRPEKKFEAKGYKPADSRVEDTHSSSSSLLP